jgi:hypothetical protein
VSGGLAGTVREDLFMWRGRVCATVRRPDGTVLVKADPTYDTIQPGEVLFQVHVLAIYLDT